jgi:hypothetical protein
MLYIIKYDPFASCCQFAACVKRVPPTECKLYEEQKKTIVWKLISSKGMVGVNPNTMSMVGESTQWGGTKIVVTLYCISRIPCLNFNHVSIMKEFHNVFAYYGRSKPKEITWQRNSILRISYDVMWEHICAKKYTS